MSCDTLIQLPIWLDNVNRFREASAKGKINTEYGDVTNRILGTVWGNGRPLTTSGTNHYGLKGPKLDKVKSMYGTNTKIFDGVTNGDDKYTSEQIENRNLAYLFLAACKSTPLITCGSSSTDPATTNAGLVVSENEGTVEMENVDGCQYRQ